MEEWESLWNTEHFDLFYVLSIIFPAGPWDFFWRWKRYEYFLTAADLSNPDVIELGSGPGIMSLKIKQANGGSLTLVDQAKSALIKANYMSKKLLNAKEQKNIHYLNKDFFKMDNHKKYDLVHSQGLIEHFELDKIIKRHADFVKKGGYVLIIAPRDSFMYSLTRKIIEKLYDGWPFGFEVPVNSEKVRKVIEENGLTVIKEKKFTFCYGCLAQRGI